MELIQERKMTNFVLSSFINVGIGLVFGFVFGTVLIIFTGLPFLVALGISVGSAFLVERFSTNLYRLYFYYRLSLDIDSLCDGDGYETPSYLTAVAFSVLTLGLYNIVWKYKLVNRLRANSPKYGFKIPETGREIVAAGIFSFGFVSAYELIKYTNRAAVVYNQNGFGGAQYGN